MNRIMPMKHKACGLVEFDSVPSSPAMEPPKSHNDLKAKSGPFSKPKARAPLRQRHVHVDGDNGQIKSSSGTFPIKSSSQKSRSSKSRENNEPMEIEELPRKFNGEGHTIHRYIRGKLLGIDIWSMGVICFTLLIGKPPYESMDVKSMYQHILQNEYPFPSHIPTCPGFDCKHAPNSTR